MIDVTCLGILVADAVAKSVDSLPAEGKLELVDQLQLHTGGCAVNTAIDLSKLGLKSAVIGKVGEDGFGGFLKAELSGQKVDISGIKTDKNCSTSASLVLVNSSGERSFLHCLGSNGEMCGEDVDFTVIENSRILFVAGALLLPKLDGRPTAEILEKARKKGIYTALDTAWDSSGRWMTAIKPCLPWLDLFIPSLEEAIMLTGRTEPEEMADLFIAEGVKTVVIKLGKDGCFIKDHKGEVHTVPAFTGITVVDTNGAGDSFVAGFLAGILQGWDLYQCGRFANAVGAHCVMKLGASAGIKPMDEILEFLNKA